MTALYGQFSPIHTQLAPAFDLGDTFCSHCSLPDYTRKQLLLIIEELFVNSILHGGNSNPDIPSIRIRLRFVAQSIELLFEDEGRAYNPFAHVASAQALPLNAHRPVGQFGLLLVSKLAAQYEYARICHKNQIKIILHQPSLPP